LVEGVTILLAFEGTDVQGTRPAVLEASTLINLGSRVIRLAAHSTTPPTPTAMGQSFIITLYKKLLEMLQTDSFRVPLRIGISSTDGALASVKR
jgi:hypothetical protein